MAVTKSSRGLGRTTKNFGLFNFSFRWFRNDSGGKFRFNAYNTQPRFSVTSDSRSRGIAESYEELKSPFFSSLAQSHHCLSMSLFVFYSLPLSPSPSLNPFSLFLSLPPSLTICLLYLSDPLSQSFPVIYIWCSLSFQAGFEGDRRDKILRTYVRNAYSYHLSEIFFTIVNEYTDWERTVLHPINTRDATIAALSDAQYVAPLVHTGDMLSQPKTPAADDLNKDRRTKSFFYVFDYQTRDGDYPQVSAQIHTTMCIEQTSRYLYIIIIEF